MSVAEHADFDQHGLPASTSMLWATAMVSPVQFQTVGDLLQDSLAVQMRSIPNAPVEVREPKILVDDDNHQSQEVEDTPWISRVFKDSQQIIKKIALCKK